MTLTELFLESCQRFPKRSALQFSDKKITYEELFEKSGKIAQALLRKGVSIGEPIVLYCQRSEEMYVALYGILLAGCAYVPLNAGDPPSRTRKILSNLKGKIALVSGTLKERYHEIIEGKNTQNVFVISDCLQIETEKIVPLPKPKPSDLVMILFTSGSTGAPKGIMIENHAVVVFVNWSFEKFGIKETDVLLGFAPLFFDLSTFDTFAAAKAGATLVPVLEGTASFPASVSKIIETKNVNTLYLVPTVLIDLIYCLEEQEKTFPQMKHVLFAGEPFPPTILPALMKTFPHARLYNLYGPTESNVCTYHELSRERSYDAGVPIGRPCPYADVKIEKGEIVIYGESLMRHYLNETNKITKFASGDFAITDDSDEIYFRGRKDQLAKIRGIRVEILEIEGVLSECKGVRRSAVFSLKCLGKNILVAIVEGDVSTKEVFDHCRKNLPSYMIPEKLKIKKTMRVLSNGKIDRAHYKEEFDRDE